MRSCRLLGRTATFLLAAFVSAAPWSCAFAEESWAVYLYLCGSDLETRIGAASQELREAAQVQLPENVQFIFMTGGARDWKSPEIDPKKLSLFKQSGKKAELVVQIDTASMGNPETLQDFLGACDDAFPADSKMLILWDHGGGSAGGICYDELFNGDSLDLVELREALAAMYGEAPEVKPFDIIGFDACLMATIDVAGVCAPYAKYLVASQHTEPAIGWKYDGFLSALVEDPGMDGAELGRVICDTYYEGCKEFGLDGDVTLSVVDLSKFSELSLGLSLVSFMGASNLVDNPSHFYAELGRGAVKADRYSSGMIDLVGLVEANAILFPEVAEIVRGVVEESVVYQVIGRYRKNSNGISVYLPSAGNEGAYGTYSRASEAGGTKSFYHLFEPLMNGDFSAEALAFLEKFPSFLETDGDEGGEPVFQRPLLVSPGSLAGAADFADSSEMGLGDHPVEFIQKDGTTSVRLDLGAEKASVLKSVTFMLAMPGETASQALFLGEDSDTVTDYLKNEKKHAVALLVLNILSTILSFILV